MIKRVLYLFPVVAIILLLIASPVFAFLANPTSMTIESIKWFRNLAVNGDMACVFHFKITCASYPTVPAADTILFRLYDTDGVTLKAVNSPYPYVLFATNGYGDGISSFYIPPGSGMTWGASYNINIYGLPLYFSGLASPTINISAGDWSPEASTTTEQQKALYNYVIKLCDDFKNIYTAVPLKTATDGEFTLSPYGESYFTGAIPGIYSMCPPLFFSQIYVPQVMPSTGNLTGTDLSAQYSLRMAHTDLERGGNRVGALIGVNAVFFYGIITVIACIASCIFCMRKGWGIESGLLVSAGLISLAAVLIGSWLFTITMIGMLVAAIAIFWILHLKKAQ